MSSQRNRFVKTNRPWEKDSAAESGSAVFIGSRPLLIRCMDEYVRRGNQVVAVVSEDTVRDPVGSKQPGELLPDRTRVPGIERPYRFRLFVQCRPPPPTFERDSGLTAEMRINFHDGILPEYAGSNVTSWGLQR